MSEAGQRLSRSKETSGRAIGRDGHRTPAAALVAGGAVSVQFGAAIATHLFHRVGPAGAVTVRLVFAALALAVISRWRAGQLSRLRGRRRDLPVAIGFGIVLAGMNLAFYEAIARVPLGVAVTIEFIGPLAVTIGGSRRRSDFLWAVLAGAGVFLLAGGDLVGAVHHLNLVGIAMAVVAGGCWAGYIVLNAETGRRFEGTTGLAIAMTVGALGVLPIGIATAGSHLLEGEVLWLGLVVAILSSAIPYSFELIALRRVTARAFGILLSMDPAIAALAGLAVLGQHLSFVEVIALILVVAANAGSSWFDSRGNVPPIAEPTAAGTA
jgi:inner membrane transporter RhtA